MSSPGLDPSNGRTGRLNATRLVAEGVVVVTSILIAFALDAWWADRQLNREMAEDLAIVEYELAENVRLVNLTVDIMERVVAANNSLIAQLKADSESAATEIPDTALFWGLFINPTLDPSLGGIDAWIAAGRLAGIESPVLRQRLASVRGKVEDVVEEQRVARDIGIRTIYPLIGDEIGDIGGIQDLFASGLHARQGTSVRALPSSGAVSVPNSGALSFALQVRTIWYEAAIKEMQDFQAELEGIQGLVRDEVGAPQSSGGPAEMES